MADPISNGGRVNVIERLPQRPGVADAQSPSPSQRRRRLQRTIVPRRIGHGELARVGWIGEKLEPSRRHIRVRLVPHATFERKASDLYVTLRLPLTTAVLLGVLSGHTVDAVNTVNAPSIASERGIVFGHITGNDPRPHYAHQSNLASWSSGLTVWRPARRLMA